MLGNDRFGTVIDTTKSLASGILGRGKHPGIEPRTQRDPQTWQAPTSGGRGIRPTNWVPPPSSNTPQVTHTALNVDGRRLATAVCQHYLKQPVDESNVWL